MMAITREDDFVSQAAGERLNSTERVYPLSASWILYLTFNKLVAVIFAVNFEVIILRTVGNEFCYPMKGSSIIMVLSSRSRRKDKFVQ
jgi:hypothetical protein